jgi:hypothetical protein
MIADSGALAQVTALLQRARHDGLLSSKAACPERQREPAAPEAPGIRPYPFEAGLGGATTPAAGRHDPGRDEVPPMRHLELVDTRCAAGIRSAGMALLSLPPSDPAPSVDQVAGVSAAFRRLGASWAAFGERPARPDVR